MPLIQGGPPEWIWERTADRLKWELVASQSLEGEEVFELRVQCGLGIMRLQFFTYEEMQELHHLLADSLNYST
jgi:hypothetical protein